MVHFLSKTLSYIGMVSCLSLPLMGGRIKSRFIFPLETDFGIVSSFGDFRANHFHAGIDFKTNKDVGFKVYAAADGFVYRIKKEYRGYGLAVYVQHSDGFSTMYGHLLSLENERLHLMDKVQNEIIKTGNEYPGDIYPDSKIPVQRGEVIAYSGESGAGGPHLHFEVRKDDNPVNPFFYGLSYRRDKRPPIFTAVYLIPVGRGSKINDVPLPYKVQIKLNRYGYRAKEKVRIEGGFKTLVSSWDHIGTKRNFAGINGLRVLLGGRLWVKGRFKELPFSMYRLVGDLFNTTVATGSGLAYKIPPDSDSIPNFTKRNMDFPTANNEILKIEASDPFNNTSSISIPMSIEKSKDVPPLYLTEQPAAISDARIEASGLLLSFKKGDVTGNLVKIADKDGREIHIGYKDENDGFERVFIYLDDIPERLASFNVGNLRIENNISVSKLKKGGGVIQSGAWKININESAIMCAFLRPIADVPEGLKPVGDALVLTSDKDFFPKKIDISTKLPSDVISQKCGIFKKLGDEWFPSGEGGRSQMVGDSSLYPAEFAVFEDNVSPVINNGYIYKSVRAGIKQWVFPVSDIGLGIADFSLHVELNGQPIKAEYDPDRGWIRIPFSDGVAKLKMDIYDKAGNPAILETLAPGSPLPEEVELPEPLEE